MSGFMSKLHGYMYEGELLAASDMTNGKFCYINGGKMTLTNSKKDTALLVKEKTDLEGIYALRCIVNSVGSDSIYFVETAAEVNDSLAYDILNAVIKQGEEVRAHRLILGDEVIFIVDTTTYNNVMVGDIVKPVADGKVAVENSNNLTIKIVLGEKTGAVSTDILVPFEASCATESRITTADVVVAETHRKINKDTAGTYDTAVVAGDCSLTEAAAAIYTGTITFDITQGKAIVA